MMLHTKKQQKMPSDLREGNFHSPFLSIEHVAPGMGHISPRGILITSFGSVFLDNVTNQISLL